MNLGIQNYQGRNPLDVDCRRSKCTKWGGNKREVGFLRTGNGKWEKEEGATVDDPQISGLSNEEAGVVKTRKGADLWVALEVLRIKSQKEDQTSGQTHGVNINLGTVRSFVVSKAIMLGGERQNKKSSISSPDLWGSIFWDHLQRRWIMEANAVGGSQKSMLSWQPRKENLLRREACSAVVNAGKRSRKMGRAVR